MDPIRTARELSQEVDRLKFKKPVHCVYNPLDYARRPHQEYLKRFARRGCEALFVGMNPGPFGMAQTGVPFGDPLITREWLGIEGKVDKPPREHAKRPILGFDSTRKEVSGQRVWGWARERFESPENFFERFFVWNYCPLVFLEESGRNRTPDKLPVAERRALNEACDRALVRIVDYVQPELVIGFGKFAEDRAREVLSDVDVRVGRVLHPSPASPLANRGWAPQAEKQLAELGIAL